MRQSENVRTGTCRRITFTTVRRLRLPPALGLAQRAVDRRGTDLQQPVLNHWIQLKMTMPLHGIDEDRNQCLQPLAAHPVAGLPQHNQCLTNCFVVETIARGSGALMRVISGQDPNGVLAVITR